MAGFPGKTWGSPAEAGSESGPESDQKVTLFVTFGRQEKTEKTRKDTLFSSFRRFPDSGGPSLPSGSKAVRKTVKTAEKTLFSAVFTAPGCLEHAQWPGHASDDTFPRVSRKARSRAKMRFISSSGGSLDEINLIFARNFTSGRSPWRPKELLVKGASLRALFDVGRSHALASII